MLFCFIFCDFAPSCLYCLPSVSPLCIVAFLCQEFNKLLMSLLERCLQRSAPPLRTLVSGLFCGELAYVTRCLTCKTASRNRNAFNDLELQIGVRRWRLRGVGLVLPLLILVVLRPCDTARAL